jgi:hypothetical protein
MGMPASESPRSSPRPSSRRRLRHLSPFSADTLEGTAQRVEGWLLESGAQLRTGPHRGGVAGWLDRDGRPEFVYLEITGYYLTMAAWLADGAASSPERRALAIQRGREALDWIASVTAGGAMPPTRLYLSPGHADDWRNAAIFVFDVAMAVRGAACFASVEPTGESAAIVRDLVLRMEEICAGCALLPSHALVDGTIESMPDRWSTRPGPHHVKAAAALLRVPGGVLSDGLLEACRGTVTHWSAALAEAWPTDQLHPLLYGLEGLLIEPGRTDRTLDSAEQIYERLMRLQAEDGSVPSGTAAEAGEVRSDVLAQALRAGALLRGAGRLQGEDWQRRLDALAEALLAHVREDGAVLFALDQEIANTWCAMFTHQALVLHARARSGALAGDEAGALV